MRLCLCLMILFLGRLPLLQAQDGPLIFWHSEPEQAEFWRSLAEEYNAGGPAIPVQVQYFPTYLHQHDAILTGLLSGNLPDVALVRNDDAALYQLSDSLIDLNLFLAGSSLSADDFYPHFWAQDVFEGQRLGLPLTRSAEALYVNIDLLGARPLPQTRAEWSLLLCEFPMMLSFEASFWLGMGQGWEALSEVIAWGKDLYAEGCLLRADDPFGRIEHFASGQSVFYLDSTRAWARVEEWKGLYFAEPFQQVILPLPTAQGYLANWGGESASLFASHPEREAAAWAWIEWLAQAEQLSGLAESNRAFPARVDLPFAAEWQAAVPYTEANRLGAALIHDELSFGIREIIYGQDLQSRLQSSLDAIQQIIQAFERPEP